MLKAHDDKINPRQEHTFQLDTIVSSVQITQRASTAMAVDAL